jgi:hypothetical protein
VKLHQQKAQFWSNIFCEIKQRRCKSLLCGKIPKKAIPQIDDDCGMASLFFDS